MPSVVGALIAQPTEPSREAASRWFHGSDARATTPAVGDRSGRCPPFCHTFRLAFDCPVSIQLYVGLHPYGDRVINAQREKCAPAEARPIWSTLGMTVGLGIGRIYCLSA